MAFAVSRQEGERGTRNRKTEGRTDESERTRSGRRITGTADEDGREERARAWTVMATDRREERAKMSAASFALVLSLPVMFAPLLFPSSPPEGLDGKEDEAGKMADRRGAALLLVVGRSAARCCDVVAIASPRSGRGGRHFIR